METWATFSTIDHLKPIGDQTQEELDQLEAVDYLREAQAGEPSFCRECRRKRRFLLGTVASCIATIVLAFPQGFT